MTVTAESRSASNAGAAPPGSVPFLFRVWCSDAPLSPPGRHALAGLSVVEIGRGEQSIATRDGARLLVSVPDPRMSTQHARLRAVAGRWVVEDIGSRNGTRVNDARTERAVLRDGDRIACGRTFFAFGSGPLPPGPLDVTADEAPEAPEAPGLATVSPGFAADVEALRRVAPTSVSVIVVGESGVGKELAARAIHALSGRRGPFVGVNCAALPAGLVEGELFGHVAGAFSGATEARPGLIRSADRGTLLLDEISDLPPAAQGALLRVLQEREVVPVGGARPLPVDFRLVVAAQRPLEELACAGAFRPDLLARVSGYSIRIPPLRERREDFGLITAALLRRLAPRPLEIAFEPSAARALVAHDWPLNVRELAKALEGALALAAGAPIALTHLPEALRRAPPPDEAIDGTSPAGRAHRDALIALLREHRGNVSAVARALGKDRVQIRRWLQRHALDAAQFRSRP